MTHALHGPWQAILTDLHGHQKAISEFAEGGDSLPLVAVVRGSAAPGPDGIRPGSYPDDDVLYEVDDIDSADHLAFEWERAQGVAAALNAFNGGAWIIHKIGHDQNATVGPRIHGRRIYRAAGHSDPGHTRYYAAQLLAAADEVERGNAAA